MLILSTIPNIFLGTNGAAIDEIIINKRIKREIIAYPLSLDFLKPLKKYTREKIDCVTTGIVIT